MEERIKKAKEVAQKKADLATEELSAEFQGLSEIWDQIYARRFGTSLN